MKKKRCLCPACLSKGTFNYNNIQKNKLNELFKALRNANNHEERKKALTDIRYVEFRLKGKKIDPKNEHLIKKILEIDDDEIKCFTIGIVSELFGGQYRDYYFQWIYEGKNINIAEECIMALLGIYGDKVLDEIEVDKCTKETIKLINEYKERY